MPAAPAFYDAAAVDAWLDYPGCIAAMRQAMAALSASGDPQPLRQILPLGDGRLFGVMPGSLLADCVFGAKLVSVFGDRARPGKSRHRGVVVLFENDGDDVVAIADAEAVTRIRTACATAAATDALARPEATRLAIFGTGLQAQSHVEALRHVRPLSEVLLWGRRFEEAERLAGQLAAGTGLAVRAVADPREAAQAADILCTVTGASKPVLLGDWVRPGTHVNLVGSSYLGPVEADSALVVAARYIADYRPSALAQASELAVAREAGLLTDAHVAGEIGEVFLGRLQGRQSAGEITLYKSLGHVAQDLAAVAWLHRRATGAAQNRTQP
ncbi:ornithine cyclodeaminase family protein [Sandaracinobacter sp. RS1-74]|uniref:ornithine cyclodeaminase family protein n=1 Tax=Sandaracinobacteroides sayramensis TaxID=2913411 RepID=UPI001EDBB2B5|nr:ornithine cyclodeaminase family protein [Sandaracinobacteroides sayramensis]MCG2842073.1 ornithine cyclodeaminase family protein [Sandaracinobacteroides sayramensis]